MLDKIGNGLYFVNMERTIKVLQSKFDPKDARLKLPVSIVQQYLTGRFPLWAKCIEDDENIYLIIPKAPREERPA